MQSERSIGIFIFVGALFCLTIAVDKYYSAVKTANELSKAMRGFEVESVGIPTITIVCGALGVMLLVAGVSLIAKSFQEVESDQLIESDRLIETDS